MPTMPERLTEGEAQVEAIRARVTEAKRDPFCRCGVCRDREVLLAARDAERATRVELEAARTRLQAALEEATRGRAAEHQEGRRLSRLVTEHANRADRAEARAEQAERERDALSDDLSYLFQGEPCANGDWLHLPTCNGSRRHPPGTRGVNCACRITLREYAWAAEARADEAERARDVAQANADGWRRENNVTNEALTAAEADAARLRALGEAFLRAYEDTTEQGYRQRCAAIDALRAALAAPAGGLLDAVRAVAKALDYGIRWMEWWLEERLCECETEHTCGRTERTQELTEMLTARARLAAALGEGT